MMPRQSSEELKMAQITINKLVGHTSKVSDQTSFSVDEKAVKVCKALGLSGNASLVSGAEAVAEMAIKILGLSRSWPIFYKLTDYFGRYEVAVVD
jgi:hypothetical protein